MSRWFGSVLLIMGASIGGAMLVLPVALATGSVWQILLWLTTGWLAMMLGALFVLEVNIQCSEQANLVSMAQHVFGRPGAWCISLLYLGLLYTLLSAYTNGCSMLVAEWFQPWWPHAFWLDVILVCSAIIVLLFLGIGSVDWLNRGLLLLKISIFIVLLVVLSPEIEHPAWLALPSNIMRSVPLIVITAFGYAIIIPSLRTYLRGNVQQLRMAIYVGSLGPWIMYTLWAMTVIGVVSSESLEGLSRHYSLADFINLLQNHVSIPALRHLMVSFASVCLLTSFLGVALALFDFLRDGLQLSLRRFDHSLLLASLIFLPLFIIAAFMPNVFLWGFHYAGYVCVLLLLLLPVLMAVLLRHRNRIVIYQVFGGYYTVVFVLILGLLFLLV